LASFKRRFRNCLSVGSLSSFSLSRSLWYLHWINSPFPWLSYRPLSNNTAVIILFGMSFSTIHWMGPAHCSFFNLIIFYMLAYSNCLYNSLLCPILRVFFSFIGPSILITISFQVHPELILTFWRKSSFHLHTITPVLSPSYIALSLFHCVLLMMDSNGKYILFARLFLLWISFSWPAFVLCFDPRHTKFFPPLRLYYWSANMPFEYKSVTLFYLCYFLSLFLLLL
jgi:hypothetical protein